MAVWFTLATSTLMPSATAVFIIASGNPMFCGGRTRVSLQPCLQLQQGLLPVGECSCKPRPAVLAHSCSRDHHPPGGVQLATLLTAVAGIIHRECSCKPRLMQL